MWTGAYYFHASSFCRGTFLPWHPNSIHFLESKRLSSSRHTGKPTSLCMALFLLSKNKSQETQQQQKAAATEATDAGGRKSGSFCFASASFAWNVRRREAMTTSVTVELMAAWTGGYNGSAAAPNNINLHRKSKHEQILDKTQVVAPPLL